MFIHVQKALVFLEFYFSGWLNNYNFLIFDPILSKNKAWCFGAKFSLLRSSIVGKNLCLII